MVVKPSDGRHGEMETRDGGGLPLTGNNGRVADNRSREGPFIGAHAGQDGKGELGWHVLDSTWHSKVDGARAYCS
jgi:hypothetical protein